MALLGAATLGMIPGAVGSDKAWAADSVAWSRVSLPSPGATRVIGGYARGCIAGAMALASEGAGYQVIRLSRKRYYGHPKLVAFIRDLGQRIEQARLGTALVGDLAQPRGGPMAFGHASHQTGLDVDIWLRLDLPRLPGREREALHEITMVDYTTQQVVPAWGNAQMDLIRLAASDARVARVFVNPVLKQALCQKVRGDRGWLEKVRPWFGHDGHMHVRLHCPADSPDCEAQKPLPEGDGCDEIDSWLPIAKPKVIHHPATPKPRRISLPQACVKLLSVPATPKRS